MGRWRAWPRLLVGAILALVGLVWVGQGAGVIPGSFMSNDPVWAVAGLVAIVAGGLIAIPALRHR